jgi:RimJ/RimL family protein N-acetyltransferase
MNQVNIYHDSNCDLFKDSLIGFSNDSYIVSLNDQIIGHFNLIFKNEAIIINYELLREFRGMGIGNDFYQIIENYVKQNFEFKELMLLVHFTNIKSMKIALKNEYQIDYNYLEEMNYNGELTNYNPYVKRKSLKN